MTKLITIEDKIKDETDNLIEKTLKVSKQEEYIPIAQGLTGLAKSVLEYFTKPNKFITT